MKSFAPMFAWMIVSMLISNHHVEAYPIGAGSCDGNGPAFSNAASVSHRSEAAGKEVTQELDETFQFLIDGVALVAGERRELDIDTVSFWQLKSLTVEGFKGFLVRVETRQGIAEFHDFLVDCETEDEDVQRTEVGQCSSSYITGCTHRSNTNKQLATGTLMFYTPLEDVKIDVTVVYENNDNRSRYAYQNFGVSFVGPPTSSPSAMPSVFQEEPRSPTPSPVNCFSGQNTVHEQRKGTIPISDLRVGDRVRTKGGVYSRVYSLGHWDPVVDAEFIQLNLDDGTKLELSEDHMVFANGAFTAAKNVRIGDFVAGEFGATKKVAMISLSRNYGVYAPLTESGHLLVSGILSSSYVDIVELGYAHEMAHWMLAPIRLYCRIGNCHEETHTNGISNLVHPIVDLALRIKSLFVPAQYALLSIGAAVLAPANALSW